MGSTFSNKVIKPYLYCCDNLITGANKQFINFAGYELDELLGKSLIEIGEMLKINSQIYLDNIDVKYSGYIFTKLLHPREVKITLFKDIITNEKCYSFFEIPNSRLDDKLLFEQAAFIDNSSGVAVYSATGLILLKANPKYIKLMNATFNKESEIIGRPIKNIVKEYVNSQAEVCWNSILEKHTSSYIKEFKDDKLVQNTTYWGFSQNCIIEKGKIKYIFETASQVTERIFKKQCMEWQNKIIEKQKTQLEQRNIQLTCILENLSEGVMISDNKGKIIMINSEAKKLMFNSSKETVSCEDLKNSEIFDMQGLEIPYEKFSSIQALSEQRVNNVRVFVKHINEECFVEISSIPIYNTSGDLTMVVSCFHDITEAINNSKKIEQQKKEMEKELKSQGEFLVNISHELKTPLNVIFATAQLFNMYCNNGTLDDNRNKIIRYVDSIKQNSYKLSKLINNIVDISKIQAGFFELKLSNNNIVEVVEEIVMSVTDFTYSKGIHIIFDTDTEEKIIACDPEKIERIVLNLISNAIKFSDKGDEIVVDIKDNIEFVEISVKDNGVGIESEHLNMIFDRFKQVENSLGRNAEGTGIGLNLVKSIVELHSGSIYVESEVGKGSKFTVKLPSTMVIHQNLIYKSKVRNDRETIRVELSDIC